MLLFLSIICVPIQYDDDALLAKYVLLSNCELPAYEMPAFECLYMRCLNRICRYIAVYFVSVYFSDAHHRVENIAEEMPQKWTRRRAAKFGEFSC